MNCLKKFMIVLSATLALWGCSDDEESTNGSNATISLSTHVIQMDRNGGDATVTVTSSGDWRLSGLSDWAHPSATSGKSGDVVTFAIDANKLDEKRTAAFKFFTGAAVASLQIESEYAYTMDLLSDESMLISKEKSAVTVELKTNIADPVITYSDNGDEWLAFDQRNDFGGKTYLVFTAAENKAYKSRSAMITISSPLTAEPVNVQLTQQQTDALIVESNTLIYDLAARTISFDIQSNIEYKTSISSGEQWITEQSVSKPQAGNDGLSTATVTYKLAEASVSRGGTIRIAATGSRLSKEVSVIQKDPNAQTVNIPDKALREACLYNGWIIYIEEESRYIILEDGVNATSFEYYDWPGIEDLTGIENFTNLTSIELGYCEDMEKVDISGLHNISSLTLEEMYNCEEYNLGDNPITRFDAGGKYSYSERESLKIIGSKVEHIDLGLASGSTTRRDCVTSIDVSECPALTTLNASRTNKVETLYLKTGQNIPNLTKNEATTIVYK